MVLITIDSKENEFEVDYANNPIKLLQDNSIALTGATLWYSWYNISDKFENNKLKYFNGTNWNILLIPDGNYDDEELNNYLIDFFQPDNDDNCPIVFDVNNATNRFILILNGKDYKVDMAEGLLCDLLGFDKTVYEERINHAPKIGNITRDVDRILIHCSIVDQSYKNNKMSDVIYSFAPNVSPGSMINIEPFHPKYLPINRKDYIYIIKIRITDQLNRLVDFNGENITLEFYIK